jgi:hypothetical protein
VAATLSAYLQRDEDLIEVIRSTVATNLTPTNAALEQLFTSIGPRRYPGIVALAYVERVQASSLGTFQRQVTADPPLGQPLTEAFSLTPPGNRPDCCLTRLIAANRASIAASIAQPRSIGAALTALLNPGFDYCQSAFNPLLQAAAGSGSPEVGEIVPLLVRSVPGASSFRDESNSDVKSLVEVAIPIDYLMRPRVATDRQAAAHTN